MKFDLHNHSSYSDGILSPKELVDLALEQKVNGFALTDHDSIFGVDEAYEYAKTKNIFVFKGIELSTSYKGQTVHIVGLFKNNLPPRRMYDFSNEIIENRINRAKKMMKNIEEIFNVKVDYDYLFDGKIITRGNMFRCILHSNPNIDINYANSMVSNTSKAYIPMSLFDTKSGIEFLKANNAITILAHPTQIKKEYLDEIASLGFDAIEARYPANRENEEEEFIRLAKKYNLLVSAGSDFHGDVNHKIIGTSTLNENEIQNILKLLNLKLK